MGGGAEDDFFKYFRYLAHFFCSSFHALFTLPMLMEKASTSFSCFYYRKLLPENQIFRQKIKKVSHFETPPKEAAVTTTVLIKAEGD